MKEAYVYILASNRNGTIYVGVTSNLVERIYKHKNHLFEGFTKSYEVNRLVYYEGPMSMIGAIAREKHIKKWNREWKVKLIENGNPCWIDLYDKIQGHNFNDFADTPGFPPARE